MRVEDRGLAIAGAAGHQSPRPFDVRRGRSEGLAESGPLGRGFRGGRAGDLHGSRSQPPSRADGDARRSGDAAEYGAGRWRGRRRSGHGAVVVVRGRRRPGGGLRRRADVTGFAEARVGQ